jgi:hypothetical protein
MKLSCPTCNAISEVEDHFGGQTADCPACNQPLIIPMPTAVRHVDPAVNKPELIQPKKKNFKLGIIIYYISIFLYFINHVGDKIDVFLFLMYAFISFVLSSILLAAGAWIAEQVFDECENWLQLIIGMALAIVAFYFIMQVMPSGCGSSSEDYDPSDYYHRP